MKTCLITGANSGIGICAARQIAQKGHRVLLVCRSQEKGLAAKETLEADTQNREIKLYVADLSLMRDVRSLAGQVMQDYGGLDVLINNAADFDLSRREPVFQVKAMRCSSPPTPLRRFYLQTCFCPPCRPSQMPA